jgi:rhodanese-related sulfurtransferase
MRTRPVRASSVLLGQVLCLLVLRSAGAAAQVPATPQDIQHATLAEPNQRTAEVSTEELRRILAERSAVVLDARPHQEYAVSHIPGALNVAPRPGVPMSAYVSDVREIERLLHGDRAQPLVLYCNGPFCGKSKRLSEELLAAGFTQVRRYQLGAPVWRALGGVMEIEPDGLRYVIERDQTAVLLDARDPQEFERGSLPRARNLPRSRVLPAKDVGEVRAAKDDGRLPMDDHNTRIIVFGSGADQARAVAEALAREAFHNVVYFGGSLSEFQAALRPSPPR